MNLRSISLLAATFLALALPLRAMDLLPGDVIVSGGRQLIIGFTFPEIRGHGSDAQFKFKEGYGGGDVLVAPDETIYSIRYGSNLVDVLTLSLQLTSSFPVAGGLEAAALAMNAAGEILVVFRDGQLRWVNGSGAPLRSDALPLESDARIASADLGIDQCTLYYFAFTEAPYDRRQIRRYDVCEHKELADFSEPLSYAFQQASVRVARDGAVWFAGRDRIYRFVDGVAEAFVVPQGDIALSLAFTAEPGTIWIAGRALRKVVVRSGAVIAGPGAVEVASPSLAVRGTARASTQTANAPLLSAFSTWMLIAALAGMALSRMV